MSSRGQICWDKLLTWKLIIGLSTRYHFPNIYSYNPLLTGTLTPWLIQYETALTNIDKILPHRWQ